MSVLVLQYPPHHHHHQNNTHTLFSLWLSAPHIFRKVSSGSEPSPASRRTPCCLHSATSVFTLPSIAYLVRGAALRPPGPGGCCRTCLHGRVLVW